MMGLVWLRILGNKIRVQCPFMFYQKMQGMEWPKRYKYWILSALSVTVHTLEWCGMIIRIVNRLIKIIRFCLPTTTLTITTSQWTSSWRKVVHQLVNQFRHLCQHLTVSNKPQPQSNSRNPALSLLRLKPAKIRLQLQQVFLVRKICRLQRTLVGLS